MLQQLEIQSISDNLDPKSAKKVKIWLTEVSKEAEM